MGKLLSRTLPLLAVGLAIGAGLRLSAQARAQTAAPGSVLEGRKDLAVVPDSPANRRLVEAAVKTDLKAIRAALAEGASADTRLIATGGERRETPVAIMVTQAEPGRESRVRPAFQAVVARLREVDAVDTIFNRSLLMAAVELEDLASVKSLIGRGASLETRTATRGSMGGGRTALFDAILIGGGLRKDASPVLVYLLDKGANPNAADAIGMTPLMEATLYGKADVVLVLLAHGADPALRDQSGRTALDYAGRRHEDAVAALLDAKSPMDLGQAATFGNVARLRAALDAGSDPNTIADGRSVLMAAVVSGKPDAVRLLLDRGARVGSTDREGRTALHLAAQVGNPEIVRLLLAHKADPDAVASRGETRDEPATPLMMAVAQARPEAVEVLLRHADPKVHGQLDGALRLNIQTAGTVPSRPGRFPRERREPREVLGEGDRIFAALLKAGASPSADRSRAVYAAADAGQVDVLAYLLDHGGSPNGRNLPSDSLGPNATALMAAIGQHAMARGEEEMLRDGSMSGSITVGDTQRAQKAGRAAFDLLLRRGADPNLADANGKIPLIYAVEMEAPDLIAPLLAHGARIEGRDHEGRTALLIAAADGHLSIVQRLVALGARCDVADAQGRTALMLAIDDGENDRAREMRKMESYRPAIRRDELPNQDGHPVLVRFLLAHGANPKTRAKDGTTALSLARREGFNEVAKLLSDR